MSAVKTSAAIAQHANNAILKAVPMSLATTPMHLSAPARVNLIGEHTDYSGGLVMPMAIDFHTHATITSAADETYRFRSASFEGDLDLCATRQPTRTGTWSDYPVGVLQELKKLGIQPAGFTLQLSGNVPLGAGLSSSASVEVASCLAILRHAGRSLTGKDTALLCQRAENDFVQSPCGIMDQFVIANAVAGHALLLNTRDLSFDLVPMQKGALHNVVVVICNSMVKHSVAEGGYGDRRKEVEEGQSAICAAYPQATDLGFAFLDQLETVKGNISHEAYLRCRHVITENARVRSAKEAMEAGDPVAMGKRMSESHVSMRDDFQNSCDELDFLVDTALALEGCYGARMTGGGFGGCTVNLVLQQNAEAFAASLRAAYKAKFDIDAETYVCEAVDGALATHPFPTQEQA